MTLTPDQLVAELREFWAVNATLSLATTDPDGLPHAANVYVVADDRSSLYFLSSPKVRHVEHLQRRADVAATAYGPAPSPRDIHGVQLHGSCLRCDDSTRAADLARFVARFPWAGDYASAMSDASFFQVVPTWIRWIDNRRGFGFSCETAWPPSAR